MNRKFLTAAVLLAALGVRAQSGLNFSNVSLSTLNISATDALYEAAYGGGSSFVVVGSGSAILTATYVGGTTGLQWTTNTVQSGQSFYTVAYGGGSFLVGASNGVVYTNNAGLTSWSPNSTIGNKLTLWNLAYNSSDNTFAAALTSGSASDQVYRSTDLGSSWSLATFGTPVNNFFGITSYSNGFAACGFNGDVRLSTDGGQTYVVTKEIKGSLPNQALQGAAVGGNNLVCVGNSTPATGAAVMSSNPTATSTWTTTTNLNGLNFVAYTGNEFIAVGYGGVIYSSPTGAAWVPQPITNSAGVVQTANTLFGVAFATNGPLQGVGLLVGTNGTVVVCATNPPAPTNVVTPGNISFTNIPDAVLSVSVSNASFQTVDWYYTNGTTLLASGTYSYTPGFLSTNTYTDYPSNYTFYTRTRDTRTEFVSTNLTPVTITVYPNPSSSLTAIGNTNICAGEMATISATLTGIGPWIVTWSDAPNAPQIVGSAGPGPFLVSHSTPVLNNPALDATSSSNFWIAKLETTNGVTSYATNLAGTNTVTVYPLPSASMTAIGNTNICTGETATISATLHGIGPWIVTWSDAPGAPQTVGSGAGPFIATHPTPILNNPALDATSSSNFWVAALNTTTGNSCGATNLAGTNTVTVYPLPSASMTAIGNTNICAGETATISATLHGIGPWIVTWSDAPGAPQTVGSGAGPFTATHPTPILNNPALDATSSSNFWVAALNTTTGNSCGATNLAGTNTVTVYPLPSASMTAIGNTNICAGETATISATLHGIGPWIVTWSDAPGAPQTVGSGAGPFIATHPTPILNNPALDATSSSNFWVAALNTTTGNSCGATNLAGTNTVTVYPLPSASMTAVGNTNICAGETATISATLHGIGPWIVTWSDAPGAPQTVGSGAGPFTATHTTPVLNNPALNATSSSNFWVATLNTTTGNSCGATNLAGTNTVTVYPLPTATVSLLGANGGITNLYSSQAVTNQVVLTGVGPWTLIWSDGTTTNITGAAGPVTNWDSVTTNLSTNVPVATNFYYVASLSSDYGCEATNLGATNTVVAWQLPTLYITDESTNVVLEWYPPAPINLESGADLTSNGVWTVIANSTVGQTNYSTNAITTNAATFYRLNTGTN